MRSEPRSVSGEVPASDRAASLRTMRRGSSSDGRSFVTNLPGRLAEEPLTTKLLPLLDDPRRIVRNEAARSLAGVSAETLRGTQRTRLQEVLEEFQKGLLLNNDRAGSHMALGALYESLGQDQRAIAAYRAALRVEPQVTGPRTNLAAVFDRLAEAAEQAAAQAGQRQDEPAQTKAAEQAAGYRQQAAALRREELDYVARDVRLLPESAGLQYRYGMLLYLHRRLEEAEKALLVATTLEPTNPQFLWGLVLFYKEQNQPQTALPLAEKLVKLRPDEPSYRQVLEELRVGKDR